MAKDMKAKVGVWSYTIGMLIALAVGLVPLLTGSALGSWSVGVLVVLGLIVGFLNVSDSEVQAFLLATVAFVVAASALGSVFSAYGLNWLADIAEAFVLFTAPGAFVVSFKALFNAARDN